MKRTALGDCTAPTLMKQLLTLLQVTAVCLSFCSAASSAASVLWAVTGVAECNATCGPGLAVRSLQFGCYPAAAPPTLVVPLPQTSPPMYVARSAVGRLPDHVCSGLQLPKSQTVDCLSLPECSERTATRDTAGTDYTWRWNLDGEIKCSARCNQAGSISVPIDCVDSSGRPAKRQLCESQAAATLPELGLPCYQFRDCKPVWKAEPWGACSRACGLGEIERKVDCYQLVDAPSGPYYQLRQGQCSHADDKPHLREHCVASGTCQPYYRLSPEKCRLQFSAGGSEYRLCNETGLVRNRPECVQLTADLRTRSNVSLPVDQSLCRNLGLTRPPPFSKCQVDAETLRQHGVKCVNPLVTREPQFTRVSSVLVQMERRESLQVDCGQSATVIPGTRVLLHCKVAYFKPGELKWKLPGSDGPLAAGDAACSRLCVVDGDLLINKFRRRDSGVYVVIAGSMNASLSLHSHTAYEAYVQAYLPRMMLLQPNSRARQETPHVQLDTPNRETLLWMPGPWSACSVLCGGFGQRRRSVRCEQLQASTYAVVSDSVCQAQLGSPPAASEPCGSHTCPVWQVGKWDEECSLRHCYTPGHGLLTRQVQCVNQANESLPDAKCSHEKKPDVAYKCRNELCQPEWRAGPWSGCSVSCGAYGFSSRQIRCVWQPNGLPAGFACETAKLELPRGFKACYNGACERLGCVDLSPVCRIYQASALCAHPSLRHSCCKTCNSYQVHVYQGLAGGSPVVVKTTV